jgi:hypothetical protein
LVDLQDIIKNAGLLAVNGPKKNKHDQRIKRRSKGSKRGRLATFVLKLSFRIIYIVQPF